MSDAPSAPQSPPGALQVVLDFGALPRAAERYSIELLEVGSDLPVGEKQEVVRATGASLTVDVPGVPALPLRLLVSGRTGEDVFVGTSEQEVTVPSGSLTTVTVDALFQPGPTREIGLLSVSSNGVPANGASRSPDLSGDGRFVVFSSGASNLASSDTNNVRDIFLRDRLTGAVSLISKRLVETLPGVSVPGPFSTHCDDPSVSDDGRFVAFSSNEQIHYRDRQRGVAFRISEGSAAGSTVAGGSAAEISAKGREVVYLANLRNQRLVVVREMERNTNEVVSFDPSGNLLTEAFSASISAEGRVVAFCAGPEATSAVYVHDRATGVSTRVTSGLGQLSLSAEGNWLAVVDRNSGLLTVRNLKTGETHRVATDCIGKPSISRDGNLVAFFSTASNLVFDDANGKTDVFVWNRSTNVYSRLNVAPDATPVEGGVGPGGPSLGSQGTRVAFSTSDRLLVARDSNGQADIFSAVVPTGGLLYSIHNRASIVRFNNVSKLDGVVAPPASFVPDGGGLTDLCLDTQNDRLYVLRSGSNPLAAQILVFNGASRLSGATPPTRIIDYTATISSSNDSPGLNIQFDAAQDTLFVQSRQLYRLASASTLEGIVPAANVRTFVYVGDDANPNFSAFPLDRRGFFLEPRSSLAFSAGSLERNGDRTSLLQSYFLPQIATLQFASRLGFDHTVTGIDLVAARAALTDNGGARSGAHLLAVVDGASPRLLVFRGNGTELPLPKLRELPLTEAGAVAVDRFTGTAYVVGAQKIAVFENALLSQQAAVTPNRVMQTSLSLSGAALDRTH